MTDLGAGLRGPTLQTWTRDSSPYPIRRTNQYDWTRLTLCPAKVFASLVIWGMVDPMNGPFARLESPQPPLPPALWMPLAILGGRHAATWPGRPESVDPCPVASRDPSRSHVFTTCPDSSLRARRSALAGGDHRGDVRRAASTRLDGTDFCREGDDVDRRLSRRPDLVSGHVCDSWGLVRRSEGSDGSCERPGNHGHRQSLTCAGATALRGATSTSRRNARVLRTRLPPGGSTTQPSVRQQQPFGVHPAAKPRVRTPARR